MLQLIAQIIRAQSNIFVALSFLVGLFTMVICFAAHPLSVNFTDVMVGCWAVSFGCLILGMISHVFSCGIAGGFGFFLSCVFCWTQLTSPTGVRVRVAVSYDVCSYIENVVIPQTGVEWSHLTYVRDHHSSAFDKLDPYKRAIRRSWLDRTTARDSWQFDDDAFNAQWLQFVEWFRNHPRQNPPPGVMPLFLATTYSGTWNGHNFEPR